MNTRWSCLVLLLPMILLQMTSVTRGEDLTGCGETKGCFSQPEGCSGDDCMAYVTWRTLEDGQSEFTLRAQATGWVAVGLRHAAATGTGSGMTPADVYACTSRREVRRSRNRPTFLDSYPSPLPQGAVTTTSAEFSNNVTQCTFTRKPSLDEGGEFFYNISGDNKYFILLAYGSSINDDGNIQGNQHERRWTTAEALSLQTSGGGPAVPKAHASLMMIALIGFAGIGITRTHLG